MKAERGAQEGAGEAWFGLQKFWTGPPRKWMMSSMKLKLATLLDNHQELLSGLSLLAGLVLQYLNRNSGQDGYCACHVPRPLKVGLGIFYILTVTVTGCVGGPSS